MNDEHKHEWKVFSTALAEVALMLTCKCGAFGTVDDPTHKEWCDSANAMEHPYLWNDNDRVNIRSYLQ